MNHREIDIWARTVWGEARGEPMQGKIAVAWVIQNRARIADNYWRTRTKPHPLFGAGKISQACLTPSQFSCWHWKDPNFQKLLTVTEEDKDFRDCLAAVMMVETGRVSDPASGATHYHATYIDPPDWTKEMESVCRIGQHEFYRQQ